MQPRLDRMSRRAALSRLASGTALAVAATCRASPGREQRPAGRIYVTAAEGRGGNAQQISGILAIDPNDLTWTQVAPAGYYLPRVSPDGRMVLSYRTPAPPDVGLYVCLASGDEAPRPLARGSITDYAWSPDSRDVFFSERTGVDFKTWRIGADGTGRAEVPIAANDSLLDASPDGRWLLTASWRGVKEKSLRGGLNTRAIHLVHPDGTGERRLLEPGPNRAAFRCAPDGRRIVLVSYEAAAEGLGSGAHRLETIEIDGGARRTLIGPSDYRGPLRAVWSPDGRELAVQYRSDDGRPVELLEKIFYRIEIVSADGKRSRRLDVLEGIRFSLGDWR
jgi:dipeptidyl aminopeptidase/acylaminoacyl peptidase